MIRFILTLNHSFLFLCISMSLGAGGSLVLFSFPGESQPIVDDYYLPFVPVVERATEFFSTMTKVMLASVGLMLITEWRRGLKWVPLVVLLAIAAATVLTLYWISPFSQEMAAGIKGEQRLHHVLQEWMAYNRIRVGLWTVQWLAMMAFFGRGFFKLERAL